MKQKNKQKLATLLRKSVPNISGPTLESVMYRIERLEAITPVNSFSLHTILSPSLIKKEVEVQKSLLEGYKRMAEIHPDDKEVASAINFTESKRFFLQNYLKEDYFGSIDSMEKITGMVKLTLKQAIFAPPFNIKILKIFVDRKFERVVKTSSIPVTFEIPLPNKSFVEMFLYEESSEIMFAMSLIPCVFFKERSGQSIWIEFDLYNTALFEVEFLETQLEVKDGKESMYIIRLGHLMDERNDNIFSYCTICSKSIVPMESAAVCLKCDIRMHLSCMDLVLFRCKAVAEDKEPPDRKKSKYDIAHRLEKVYSTGVHYCALCGKHMEAGNDALQCKECKKHYHGHCGDNIPNSCGISVELRKKIFEFDQLRAKNIEMKSTTKIDDFKLLLTIGKGGAASVALAEHKESGSIVALKVIQKQRVRSRIELECVSQEKSILKRLTDLKMPFSTHLKYFFQDNKCFYFGLEYVEGGDLMHYVLTCKLSEKQIRFFVVEIIAAIEYLHQSDIAYRDLKLENILLTKEGHVKICDFGLAKENMQLGSVAHTYCGTLDTVAPEVLEGDGYTRAIDFWSLGIVLYEMLHKRPPFVGSSPKNLVEVIRKTKVVVKADVSVEAKDFLSRLLFKDIHQRLGYGSNGFHNIKSHPWFNDIDWDQAKNGLIKPEFQPEDRTSTFQDRYGSEPCILSPAISIPDFEEYWKDRPS